MLVSAFLPLPGSGQCATLKHHLPARPPRCAQPFWQVPGWFSTSPCRMEVPSRLPKASSSRDRWLGTDTSPGECDKWQLISCQ